MLLAALLFGAGCRDMTMDLLHPPPSASAGTGGDGAGGMAGDTPAGDAAESGTGGTRADGGFGGTGPGNGGSGYGGSGACGPGTNCPPPCQEAGCPCFKHTDCPADLGLPFCQYGGCVACLTNECAPGQCGCDPEETCAEIVNYCVPRCSTDAPCQTKERPYCYRNACAECVTDKDCEGNDRRKHCVFGTCFECARSEDCKDNDAPVCQLNFTCDRCWSDLECGDGWFCEAGGSCRVRPPQQQQLPPQP